MKHCGGSMCRDTINGVCVCACQGCYAKSHSNPLKLLNQIKWIRIQIERYGIHVT
jgi:hypothetical protein